MSDSHAIIEKLRDYDRQFRAILDLIGNKSRLMGEAKAQAHELLRELKDNLDRDCRELKEREQELSQDERGYLEPALSKAMAYLTVPVNTTSGSKWRDTLNYSHVDITWTLNELERARPNDRQ